MSAEIVINKENIRAALDLLRAVAEAVRDVGPQGAPSGVVYAALMAHGVDMQGFTSLVNTLKNAGLVEERGHVLRWTGPAAVAAPRNCDMCGAPKVSVQVYANNKALCDDCLALAQAKECA